MKKSKLKNIHGSNFHVLKCKYCGTAVPRCDIRAVKVTCSMCTHKLVEGKILEERN